MLSHHHALITAALVFLTPAGLALAALAAVVALRFCRDIDTPRNQDDDEDQREPDEPGLPMAA